jgi:O-antigen/teichoic acid export membrane protein
MAKPIILIWLGPSWLEVVPLVRLLCIAHLSLFAACLTYPVLVAAGSVRDPLLSSLIALPPSLLVMFGASFFSVEAVAASALLTLPSQAAVERGTIGPLAGVLVACGSAAGVWIAALFAVQHPLLPELKAPVARVFTRPRA